MLSDTTVKSINKALAAILMSDREIRDNLTEAVSAENAASAREMILKAKESADLLKFRIDNAYYDALRDARADEEAAGRIVKDRTHLRVVCGE